MRVPRDDLRIGVMVGVGLGHIVGVGVKVTFDHAGQSVGEGRSGSECEGGVVQVGVEMGVEMGVQVGVELGVEDGQLGCAPACHRQRSDAS